MPDTARLGLDLGSVNVKLVALNDGSHARKVILALDRPARGAPAQVALELLDEAAERLGRDLRAQLAVTGAAASRITGAPGELSPINEIVAAAVGAAVAAPRARTIIDLGGQFSKWILLDHNAEDLRGRVADFALNGLCAAGSGAFLEQQASRLGLDLDELGQMARGARRAATIAGRCSVFAKSDMIHLQQEGAPFEEIAYGLCLALARTFASTVLEGRPVTPPVALVGGGASNPGLIRALAEVLELSPEELTIPEGHLRIGALGAALALAPEAPPLELARWLERQRRSDRGAPLWRSAHPGLASRSGRGTTTPAPKNHPDKPVRGHLGIDVGSVSTNIALLSPELELIEGVYLPTRGQPVAALDEALTTLERHLGDRLEVLSVGATGSGRHLADRLIGADLVKNEITAQLASALEVDPEVDTVFEIGGQDSKYIDARGGRLRDFEMNKICAAGTGSFLEEQAERLGVSIVGEFTERALDGVAPVDLGSRCTVFMDAELCRAMTAGAPVEELCAGLAYAVARNYLEKVVAGRELGDRVLFQGGTSANGAVVAAFEQLLGREVTVHPQGRLSGAIGAALLSARSSIVAGSRFRGLDSCRGPEAESFQCRRCDNRCQVNRVRVGDRRAHFGDLCERYSARDHASSARGERPVEPSLFAARAALFEQHLPPPRRLGRARVGLLRSSLSLELLPFWATLIDELGFQPVVAPLTSGAGRHEGSGLPPEVCLPLKRAAAQASGLIDEHEVEMVLMPSVLELGSRQRGDRPHTCLYTQQLPDMMRLALGRRVLAPQLAVTAETGLRREGTRHLARALDVSSAAVDRAWGRALEQQRAFGAARERLGRQALESLGPERAVVVLGKPYNLHDPRANLDLARHLERLGFQAIPMDLLPLGQSVLGPEWYMLPWQLNRDQVRALEITAGDRRLAPIHVSSYGCGPDGFTVAHLERAWGRRPRLFLEFDEHRGEAGLITRLEAFADELESHEQQHQRASRPLRQPQARNNLDLPPGTRCLLPHTSPHVYAYAGALRRAGLETIVLDPPDEETLRLGEEHASGRECHPYSIILGDLVKRSNRDELEPGDRFFVPSTRLPCLLGQYGDGFRRALERLGESRIEVLDQHPGEANALLGLRGMIALYEGLTIIDYLIVAGCLTRPRELRPGAVDRALAEGYAAVGDAIAGGGDAGRCLRRCLERLDEVPLGPPKLRPIVGVTGDLYTRVNPAGNASLFARLEAMGCTVWPSPFFAASIDFEVPRNAARWLGRGVHKRAAREAAVAAVLGARASRLATLLDDELRPRCVEPPQPTLQRYAQRYVGADSNHLVRGLVAKLVDFAQRGADGAISAIGLGCMVGTSAAAAIPAIRRDHDGFPIASIAYGGAEGPAQQIRLETFVHQVRQWREARWASSLQRETPSAQPREKTRLGPKVGAPAR